MNEVTELMNEAYENWKAKHGDFWTEVYKTKCDYNCKIVTEKGLNDYLLGTFSKWLRGAI